MACHHNITKMIPLHFQTYNSNQLLYFHLNILTSVHDRPTLGALFRRMTLACTFLILSPLFVWSHSIHGLTISWRARCNFFCLTILSIILVFGPTAASGLTIHIWWSSFGRTTAGLPCDYYIVQIGGGNWHVLKISLEMTFLRIDSSELNNFHLPSHRPLSR